MFKKFSVYSRGSCIVWRRLVYCMAEARVLYGGQGGSILYGGSSFLFGGASWQPGIPSLTVQTNEINKICYYQTL